MSTTVTLKARPRAETGKEAARKLRAEGRIPAVLYGRDMETRSLSLDRQETDHLFRSISVENTLIDLVVEGEGGAVQTLVREIQSPPHRPDILHVDFLRIQAGVALEVEIPVSFVGVPSGVREGGGILEQLLHQIPVKCIPSKIPEEIRVDVSELVVGDMVHVSQLEVGPDVEILLEPEQAVCMVSLPRAAVAEVEEEEPEVAEGVEEEAPSPDEG